ncbi:DNRLRE domain-containing protein [Cystobacter fuscus]|uniref:CBM96 family carbohydrate-binding protein n=1 Tax=Cystobacter fuscus TaxID=43 RepID=UPI002B2B0DE3|nr:DNRLRE domain-containing protein [Cystobacter fuscus]
MRWTQWWRGLGLLPALGWVAVGCGGVAESEAPGTAAEVMMQSVEARTAAEDCKPITLYTQSGYGPSHDTYVVEDSPNMNYGAATKLVSDGAPRQETFLRFNVSRDEPIVSAKIRLFAKAGSSNGPALYATSTQWDENSLTWSTRPAPVGGPLSNLGEITSETWVDYDVTAAVKGPGDYAFVLLPEGGDGVEFGSMEDTRPPLHPMLILQHAHSECTYRGTGGTVSKVFQKGGAGDEQVQVMATDGTGAFVVAGTYTGNGSLGGATFPGQGGLMLGRFRADGSHEWSRAYPQAAASLTATGVALTPLGNILVVGTYAGSPDLGTGPFPSTSVWYPGTFIAKFSPSGQLVWARGFSAIVNAAEGDAGAIRAQAVATDANGSLIVTGYFYGWTDLGGGELFAGLGSTAYEEPAPGMFIAKFSWEGEHLWSRAYSGGNSGAEGQSLATDSAGNVLLGGYVSLSNVEEDVLGATGPRNPLIARFSPEGVLQWARVLHGASGRVTGVAALPGDAVAFGGDFIKSFTFGGQTVSSAGAGEFDGGEEDVLLGVLEASGADRWARRYGTLTGEYVRRMVVDAWGNLQVVGVFRGRSDVGGGTIGANWQLAHGFVASYGPNGAHRWSRALAPDLDTLDPVLLAVTPEGATLVGGTYLGTVQVESTRYGPSVGQDLLLLKLAP